MYGKTEDSHIGNNVRYGVSQKVPVEIDARRIVRVVPEAMDGIASERGYEKESDAPHDDDCADDVGRP